MIPKFASQTEMIEFLRALPKNANYKNMLAEDFGISAPDESMNFHREYLWKYLIQGQFLGKQGVELMTYAVDKTHRFAKEFPWTFEETDPKPVTALAPTKSSAVSPDKRQRQKIAKQPDGTVQLLEHRGVWVGWHGSKVVVTKKTEAAVKEWMAKKFA